MTGQSLSSGKMTLWITGGMAVLLIILNHYAHEYARKELCCWYDKSLPTLRHISLCNEILEEIPENNLPTTTSEFRDCIRKFLENFYAEYQTYGSYLHEGESTDRLTLDAWSRPLNYSRNGSEGLKYEIVSAGKDGLLNTRDDIGIKSSASSTLKRFHVVQRIALLLFLTAFLCMAGWAYMAWRRKDAVKKGVLILLAVVGLLGWQIINPPLKVDPAYRVPISFLQTAIRIGIFGGVLTAGLLMKTSSNRWITCVGWCLCVLPIAFWSWWFWLEVVR